MRCVRRDQLFCGGRQLAKTWAKTESAVQPLHVACFTMPQTLEEWLTSEYGADLSAVTAISGVPSNVTGKFLFSRTLKSLYLPTIFALQTAETITNLNPLTPLPILRIFRSTGTLDALANCKKLRVLNCSGGYNPMKITGTHAIANLKR